MEQTESEFVNKGKIEINDSADLSSTKIYTKTGDSGISSLYTGERKQKNHEIFEALGNVDELSSQIGLSITYLEADGINDLSAKLEYIQCVLQDICSNIAMPKHEPVEFEDASKRSIKPNIIKERKYKATEFQNGAELVKELERWIDEYHVQLPKLVKFILPSGGFSASSIHIARSMCRRAERSMVSLLGQMDAMAFKYVNRLSDFLFVSARYAAHKNQHPEKVYIKRIPV
ncbi:hypothetical protein BB559_003748 [Furculomyces boomerangus]|uniref:Corrinoid adenosyltransferase MMAB n=2 Tax=Harpellales TaxID=61421 RepID=A0A2T9YJ21_9FUNG|nr:hypothetical protein BB559_003748 [Furculomyces boomerangus]PWA02512.1 hypothetical protein BB558_001394 [Smittium angustum]